MAGEDQTPSPTPTLPQPANQPQAAHEPASCVSFARLRRQGSIHVIMVLMGGTLALQISFVLCQILHLRQSEPHFNPISTPFYPHFTPI